WPATHPGRVHAAQVVERAERDAVLEGVRALRGAEADVVVVQVLHRGAARHGAAPPVAVEHPVARGDLSVEGAPARERMIEHGAERLPRCREPSRVSLHRSAYGAEDRPK